MSQVIAIVGSYAKGFSGFRSPILRQIIEAGWQAHLICSEHDDDDLASFKSMGVTYHVAPLSRTGLNPLADLKYQRYLTGLFRELRPDIVFCYAQKPVVFGVPAARKAGVGRVCALMPGLGYAFSAGGGLKKKIASAAARGLHRRAKPLIDHLFFVNPQDQADFRSHGLIGSQVEVTLLPGEGKDLAHFARQPFPSQGKIRFSLITRLLVDKGVLDFVEAARIVKQTHPEAIFDVIGAYDELNPGGVRRKEMERWVDEGLIEYHGSTTDVRPYLADSWATVLPTTYREGFPNVLMEGMALGRAVVTYQNPGASQAVDSPREIEPGMGRGSNGFLLAPKRVDLLAKSLLMLIEEEGLAEAMGNAGRAFAESYFDVAKINTRILQQIGVLAS